PAAQRIVRLMRLAFEKLSWTAQPSERYLSIEERLAIGPKRTLMLVNCRGRRFLLAMAGDTISPMIEVRPLSEGSSRGVEADIAKQEERL
ncbi:MAG TPA: flagellar biosynthetic protein FliO, partial [Silvibacterium sp.]|nr:flagellar biosynthetic protein FliO [Silvibacterium sp.]